MVNFFIDRPIFAWVVAIVIMLAGGLAITTLPIESYPDIAPPAVQIRANYPGASARTVDTTVTQVIEQQMVGLDGLLYMAAESNNTGDAELTLTFQPGTDPDIAQVQVQNKLQLALPLLPDEVAQQGVRVAKVAQSYLMVLALVSEDGSMTQSDIGDFVAANLVEPLGRVDGVGDVLLFGAQHAMRIWLDPERLTQYNLTASDVNAAIRIQNEQVAAGQLGGLPAVPGQQLNAVVSAQSRLETAAQFRDILLKVQPDGARVYLRDVARVEVGSENYAFANRYNGKPAAGMAITTTPGANALATAAAVRARLAELQPVFPAGLAVRYAEDSTPFVRTALKEVAITLVEAIALVFLVMLLFLQNLRATLIPTIAVPVVLLGTLGIIAVAGFSINMLTMFSLVLAIGLLVDDAIVVVENVERVMHEENLDARSATRKSMRQITGALVGIGAVLSAVFIPMAFFPGTTGAIYRQFSLTIASAMGLSVLVALVFTPSLCATLLKPKAHAPSGRGPLGAFQRGLETSTNGYVGVVGYMARRIPRFLLVYVLIVGALGLLFLRLPGGFLPDEDQGTLYANVMLPPGATTERTTQVIEQVGRYFYETEKDIVFGAMNVYGFSFGGRGQNVGLVFVNLKDWEERPGEEASAHALAARASRAFAGMVKDGLAFAFAPPSVRALGRTAGFDLQLQDRAGLGHDALLAARNQLLGMAAQSPVLTNVRPNGLEDAPQYVVRVDQAKARALGLSMDEINQTLKTAWGSTYVNDYIEQGRTKKVFVQGDAPYRMLPEDLEQWYVRNSDGEMVPFSAFSSAEWTLGSPRLERYNGVPSSEILGEPARGYSSGDAMAEMERLAAQLPPGIGYEWTGLSYQEKQAGSQAPLLYAISALVVFLALAALYESWSVPFAVMLVVPLGLLGAVLAALLRGLNNDVFFQVGLLTTMGLTSKNAILIVEFAHDLHTHQGKPLIDAVLEAARIRLRPILMTSMAFVLGVMPLAIATGAGAASRIAIGTGVIGGMATALFLATFFIPLFYVAVRRLFGRNRPRRLPTPQTGV
ncbi:efflux RND transporter permease subunit [Immundisolibacter sp.]|uniref:efflux RND transporter permease subunit n=1 Tax=Immundisolibacter sp. TaxID=1934948 RepID=UPI002B076335|nr:efflux RND transporter permease subunit [Immundisolibacter sp.]MEA3218996.1 Multidrug efflux pump subunit AcrB [Immundisolibacter sp.]